MNLSGATTLREAMALISKCNLFVTNDSGLMHTSAALGIPTVAIFASTNPNLTGPIGKGCVFVYKGVECSPCYKRKCPTDFKCMHEVAVSDVMDGISKIIGAKAL
jgi:heptosyltransferase-2